MSPEMASTLPHLHELKLTTGVAIRSYRFTDEPARYNFKFLFKPVKLTCGFLLLCHLQQSKL